MAHAAVWARDPISKPRLLGRLSGHGLITTRSDGAHGGRLWRVAFGMLGPFRYEAK